VLPAYLGPDAVVVERSTVGAEPVP
jgi:hypothetical protein